MKKTKAIVFNAYGTLLDSFSPFDQYKDQLGKNALVIYKLWRGKRLQYSSQLCLMNRYTSYDKITRYALDYACDAYDVHDEELKDRIIAAHSTLECYPDIKETLETLHKDGYMLSVLSNGSPKTVKHALEVSGIEKFIDRRFSTDLIKAYKPSPAVYEYVNEELAIPSKKICFVSSNTWDIAG
jgi:2-haloacid dehalogenase